MKSKLDRALALAAEGFHVFPLESNSKLPHIDDYPNRASRDEAQIRSWWTCPVTGYSQDFNIAISTTRFRESDALIVVDIDIKGDKHGDKTVLALADEGFVLPATRETRTPTGGLHKFYRVQVPASQGANKLGDGVDIRSYGGYVVAPGSYVAAGEYVVSAGDPVAEAPAWLVERCRPRDGGTDRGASGAQANPIAIDQVRARNRAVEYLNSLSAATAGERNHKGFITAAKLKDFGLSPAAALELMVAEWKCEPALDPDELAHVVNSAYRYGREAPGSAAPEVQFSVMSTKNEHSEIVDNLHPFEKLNREFAFVLAGGGHHILWETVDEAGNKKLEHLSEAAFHKRHASQTMQQGKKAEPVTELWMRHKSRRSYDGLVFMPGEKSPPQFYNLWRGFAVEPAKPGTKHASVDAFLNHALENVCHGNKELSRWLIGFFAHMVQRPQDKPLVALVFRGSKGVGKNALIERVGALLGSHFLVTANRRYLVGNFNGHLENCLLFALDEAFWSGDKQAEGTIKDLITGKRHVIEHKGKEPFTVSNKTRVAIIGNEDWLVPASHDERRFAVFDVGEGRKQDRTFFQTMREGMERGGYAVLLRYLLDVPLTGLDFNEAPRTKALLEQKHASLEPIQQWWHECLTEGSVVGGDFEGWPTEAETDRFRAAHRRYVRDRNIRSRTPDSSTFGRALIRCAPNLHRKRVRRGEGLMYVYSVPSLEDSRKAWEQFIGHPVEWEK